MSLLGKKWEIGSRDLNELWGRKPDDQSVTFHDPFMFKDMEKAVARLEKAVKDHERIVVFGDYDVDGISGTALLVQALRALGAQVSYRLPTRADGYGMNPKWVDEFMNLEVNVLITVDCGISNHKEIDRLNDHGIDTIITDHHAIPEVIPEACAIIHPNLTGGSYPFHDLAGSGAAYKLAVGLIQKMRGPHEAIVWRDRLADLACLGTVADCVSLTGENRWIVKRGLDQMAETHWPGMRMLLDKIGVKAEEFAQPGYNSDLIGFRIGPRINASGRLETPYYALQLLLNENGSAPRLAEKLEQLNEARRALTLNAIIEAENQIQNQNLLQHHVIMAHSSDWPAGIIGLIAARLSEKYHRPAIIMEDRGEKLVGSCRSPEGYNVVDGLRSAKDHLTTFGGHAQAAGFTVPKSALATFTAALQKHTRAHIKAADLTPILHLDYQVKLSDLSFDFLNKMTALEPFGVGNPRPRFMLHKVTPSELRTIGREHRHLRFKVGQPANALSAVAFRFGDHYDALMRNRGPMDVAFELERNVWKGRESLQLRVVDIRI